jgi:enoyl-CoA hydratase
MSTPAPDDPAQHLLVSQPTPHVTLLTLNRPAKRNALTNAMLQRLVDELRAAQERGARCVVLTGTPPGFCSGGD